MQACPEPWELLQATCTWNEETRTHESLLGVITEGCGESFGQVWWAAAQHGNTPVTGRERSRKSQTTGKHRSTQPRCSRAPTNRHWGTWWLPVDPQDFRSQIVGYLNHCAGHFEDKISSHFRSFQQYLENGKYGTPPHLGWWVDIVRGFALTLAPSCGTQRSGAWKRKTLRAPTANSFLGLGTWSLHSPLKQQPLRGYVPRQAMHEAGTCEAWTGQPLATAEKARLLNVSILLRRHIKNRLNPETICLIRRACVARSLNLIPTTFEHTHHRQAIGMA